MISNALLRSGVQINFWQSNSGRRGKFASGVDRSRRHLDFWIAAKMYVRSANVGLTKRLDQCHLFEYFNRSIMPSCSTKRGRIFK